VQEKCVRRKRMGGGKKKIGTKIMRKQKKHTKPGRGVWPRHHLDNEDARRTRRSKASRKSAGVEKNLREQSVEPNGSDISN